jgi:hypothetical protein
VAVPSLYSKHRETKRGESIMVRFQRTAIARGANVLKAIEWAKEITEFINKKYPQGKLQLFTGRFAPYGTIYWAADFEDFAALDRLMEAITADQEYWALLSKAEGLFLEGRGSDVVMVTA